MTLQKLAAGSGYEYLTRQVAALDSTEKGSIPLADHYAAKGESPGCWVGAGLSGMDGLELGDIVTAEQMKNLFGTGCDPVSGRPLGSAYKVYANETVNAFKREGRRAARGCAQADVGRARHCSLDRSA